MQLIMFTRKVDQADALAGFVYNWVKKIGQQLDCLYVITWHKSNRGDLPQNIKIISLPNNKILRILALQLQLIKFLPKVDGVFCHMNPEYTILAAPLAKFFRKKIVSWYTHSAVSKRMKRMEKLADTVLSASSLSFRLPSKKLVVTGHGIDVGRFLSDENKKLGDEFHLLSVGRISPTKDYESMIKAVDILAKEGVGNVKLTIIGDAGLKNQAVYFDALKQMVEKMNLKNQVEFLGVIPNIRIPQYLQQSDVLINLSGTGSLDKAVLEAMASGCLVLTSNEAFAEVLPPDLMVDKNQPAALATKIKWLLGQSQAERLALAKQLRGIVVAKHNLDNLAEKIVAQFR